MTTTIRIADTVHPSHAADSDDIATVTSAVDDSIYQRNPRRTLTNRSNSSEDYDDGIYNMRSRTRAFSRTASKEKSSTWRREEDEDPGIQQSGDFRQKEVCGSNPCLNQTHFLTQD